jgi:hypothetical protein
MMRCWMLSWSRAIALIAMRTLSAFRSSPHLLRALSSSGNAAVRRLRCSTISTSPSHWSRKSTDSRESGWMAEWRAG